MSDGNWITFSEAAEIIKARLDCSVGRAEHLMRQAKASGEVRDTSPPQALRLAADDGLLDFELQPGTLPRRPLPLRYSVCDLLDWLKRNHAQRSVSPSPEGAPPKSRGGRPPKLDRAAVANEVYRLMDHHGEFSSDDPEWNAQARLVEAIRDKFGEAAPSTIDDYIKEPLALWRERHPKT